MCAGATMTFQAMVDPAFGVTADEAEARQALLRRASANDHDFAVQGVAGHYSEYLVSRTLTQRKILPSQAPPKFAASRYYALLRERVGEQAGGDSGPVHDIVREVVSPQAQQSGALSSSGLSGIDMILSGQASAPSTFATEAFVHKSALAFLQSASPRQDALGTNAEAMGSIAGRMDALFGAVEAQKTTGGLHYHFFAPGQLSRKTYVINSHH